MYITICHFTLGMKGEIYWFSRLSIFYVQVCTMYVCNYVSSYGTVKVGQLLRIGNVFGRELRVVGDLFRSFFKSHNKLRLYKNEK